MTPEEINFILSEFTSRYRAKFNLIPSGGVWLEQLVRSETDSEGFTQFSFNVMSKKGIRAQGVYSPAAFGCDAELTISI